MRTTTSTCFVCDRRGLVCRRCNFCGLQPLGVSVCKREKPPGTQPGRLLCYLNHPLRRGFSPTIFRHPFGCLVNFAQTGTYCTTTAGPRLRSGYYRGDWGSDRDTSSCYLPPTSSIS